MYSIFKHHLALLSIVLIAQTTIVAQPTNDNATTTAVLNPIKAHWSEEYRANSNRSELSKIVATEAGGFYALRTRRGGLLGDGAVRPEVQYYDNALKMTRTRELDLEVSGKNRELKDVIMVGRKLQVLTYFYNQKLEKTFLFAQKLDAKSLNLSSTIVKIDEKEGLNRNLLDPFGFQISKDSSKIVVFNQPLDEKENRETFSLKVYDADFKTIWAKEVVMPYKDGKFSVEEYQVGNDGTVYLLGMVFDEKPSQAKGRPTFRHEILTCTDSTDQLTKIELPNQYITDLTFRMADNGDLVCAGFYSDKGATSMKGTCYFRINPTTNQTILQNAQPFSFEFLTANLSAKSKEKARLAETNNDKSRAAELYDYTLDKLILRSDGGAILVAEQYYLEERRQNNFNDPYNFYGNTLWRYNTFGYNNYNNTQSDYYYHYNDIVVVNIRPDGTLEWASRIPKRQTTANDGGLYSSYAMSTVQDKLYFVYNDHPRNFDPKRKNNSEYDGKMSIVAVAAINREGQVDVKPLFSDVNADVVTRPKACRQVGRREMTIYGERGKSYRFAALKFE
jgi:hypothetical protein